MFWLKENMKDLPGDQIETNGIEQPPRDVGGVANQIGIGRDYPSSILSEKSARVQMYLLKFIFSCSAESSASFALMIFLSRFLSKK